MAAITGIGPTLAALDASLVGAGSRVVNASAALSIDDVGFVDSLGFIDDLGFIGMEAETATIVGGSGVASGSGVLIVNASITGIGSRLVTGTGTLLANDALLVGGTTIVSGSGALEVFRPTSSGSGLNYGNYHKAETATHSGIGVVYSNTLLASAASITGTGVRGVTALNTTPQFIDNLGFVDLLDFLDAYTSTGDSELRASTASLVGGTSVISGSGQLKTPRAVSGADAERVVNSTGMLFDDRIESIVDWNEFEAYSVIYANDASLVGGTSVISGSGECAVSTATLANGIDSDRVVNAVGSLQASNASCLGGTRLISSVGILRLNKTAHSGTGLRIVNSSGTYTAKASTHAGTGGITYSGSGVNTPEVQTHTGTGLRIVGGTGAFATDTSTHVGVGDVSRGVMSTEEATHAGTGLRIVGGTGTFSTISATHSGIANPIYVHGQLVNTNKFPQLSSRLKGDIQLSSTLEGDIEITSYLLVSNQ